MNEQNEVAVHDAEAGMPPVHAPLSRPFGHGLTWVSDAWSLFKQSWGLWIGGVVAIWFVTFLLGLLPALGPVLQTVLGPLIYAGIYQAASKGDYGQRLEFSDFFAGFRVRSSNLLRLGLLNLAALIVVFLLTALLLWLMLGSEKLSSFASAWASMGHGGMSGGMPDPETMHGAAGEVFIFATLIFLLLFLPYMAAVWFATPLVFFADDVRPLQAYAMSLKATVKNVLPMFLFSILALVLLMIGGLTFGIGFIITVPVLFITMWTSFHDIFVAPEYSRFA